MGCTASRPQGRPFFDSPPPPPTRTLSLPATLVHHPAVRRGDSNHIVSLTSSTLGSLDFTPFPPTTSPPDSPLVIDADAIMSSLDDSASSPPPSAIRRSLTLHRQPSDKSRDRPINRSNVTPPGRPLWKHLSEESLLADMDPAVAAVYQRAAYSKDRKYSRSTSKPSAVPVSCALVETVKPAKVSPLLNSAACEIDLPDGVDKIVVYFTTLRGIRRTYEDCCAVLNIFAGFRVAVDERDISMDSSLRKELLSALGQKTASLPQVFVRGKRVGGADEIKQLLETGELAKLLHGFPVKDGAFPCQSCGGVRFFPCGNCNGSRKVYYEEDDQLRRCPDCNENGLIRCPDCCK